MKMNLRIKWEKFLLVAMGITFFAFFSIKQVFSKSFASISSKNKEIKFDENFSNEEIKSMVPGTPQCVTRPCGTIGK